LLSSRELVGGDGDLNHGQNEPGKAAHRHSINDISKTNAMQGHFSFEVQAPSDGQK